MVLQQILPDFGLEIGHKNSGNRHEAIVGNYIGHAGLGHLPFLRARLHVWEMQRRFLIMRLVILVLLDDLLSHTRQTILDFIQRGEMAGRSKIFRSSRD